MAAIESHASEVHAPTSIATFLPLFTGMCTDPGLDAGAEMRQGFRSGSGTPPDVTGHHGEPIIVESGPAELMAELSHVNLGCPRGIVALTVPGQWAVRFGGPHAPP
jgi:hypothetical protein